MRGSRRLHRVKYHDDRDSTLPGISACFEQIVAEIYFIHIASAFARESSLTKTNRSQIRYLSTVAT